MAAEKLRTAALVWLTLPTGRNQLFAALLQPARTGPLRADLLTPAGVLVRKIERPAIAAALHRQFSSPQALQARVDAALARTPEADLEVAWQLAVDEPVTASELAGLLYGKSGDDDRDDALLAAMLRDDAFCWRDGQMARRTAAERQAASEALRRHRAALAQVAPWLEAVQRLRAGFAPAARQAAPLAQVLEAWLLGRPPETPAAVWADDVTVLAEAALYCLAPDEAPSVRRAAALLVELGHWDGHDDLGLLRSPAAAPWPYEVAVDTAPQPPTAKDWPVLDLPLWAIDNDAPHEIDDGLCLQALADGGWRLHVAVAAPVAWLPAGSAADEAACKRGATLYHPRYAIGMLPDVLARDVASLSVEAPRPAMVLAADIAADGHWSAPAVQFGWVRLAAAPAYDQLDALLAGKPLPRPLRQPVGSDVVQLLWQFAQLREQRRVHNGGYLLYKPDVDVRAPRGGGVQLVDSSQTSPARRIVTEAMVIACAAAAQLAVHAGVPLLFRSQPPLREPPLPPGLYTQPSHVLPLFRCLAATATAPTPAPHAVIGEPAYVQVTSPLRRYGDLLAQQQLLALWRGEPPPWSAADVMARHQLAEQGQQARRGAQRKADRYFKLVWLAGQRPGRSWPAQVVRPAGHGEVVVTLPELAMDAVVLARGARVGDQLSVVVRAVDPAADRLELNAV